MVVGQQQRSRNVRSLDALGQCIWSRSGGVSHISGLGDQRGDAGRIDRGLIEPPVEAAIAVALGVEVSPAGAARIAAAKVDVQIVDGHLRGEIAGGDVRRLLRERGSEKRDAQVLRGGFNRRLEGEHVQNAGGRIGAAAVSGHIALVGRLQRFHVVHFGSKALDGLRSGGSVIGNHVVALDSGGRQLQVGLNDGRRRRPGIVAVADVMNAQRLELAEHLGKICVIRGVSVAEVRDHAHAVNKRRRRGCLL